MFSFLGRRAVNQATDTMLQDRLTTARLAADNRVRIRDDGEGFDVEEAISSRDRPRGLGLLGMKERVELMNGTLSIRSCPDGGGTEIDIEIPTNREVGNG